MRIYDIQTAFARGELSPRLHARTDIDHYRMGLAECTNWYVLRQGALRKRPGTQFISEVKTSAKKTRLVPFTFSTEQAYVLEFGDAYCRIYAEGGRVEDGDSPVEVVTPYPEAQLFELKFAQSADTLYVAHSKHAPRKITRTSDTAWTSTEIDFRDGPYLPENFENTTTMSLSATGDIVPVMTSNTTPSGAAAASGGTAYLAFDKNQDTNWSVSSSTAGWLEYDSGSPEVCVGYYLQGQKNSPANQPKSWTFEGYNGSDWVVLDNKSEENGWGSREWRWFAFENATAFDKYRINITDVESSDNVGIPGILFKESPDTMSDITLTASSAADINDGQGFLASDLGRTIRLQGSEGVWRWFRINTRTSVTVVTGVLYGPPLIDLSPIRRWRIGAFSDETGYPGSVSFFEERLVWARTDAEPQRIWGSRTFAFEDHGVSSPLVEDDAFSIEIASDQVNEVKWISEASDLLIGTSNAIRTLGAADTSKAFSATNVRQRRHTTVGSAALQPARIGSVSLYADQFSKGLRELFFSFESNAFTAPELTILSDHLLASGIVDMAFAEAPDSIVWIAVAGGDLISLTFERDQRIVGMARHPVAGGGADGKAFVESVTVIPGSDASEVWMVVRRTIGGATKRYVERLSAPFEAAAIQDAKFLDSFLAYDGVPTGTVTGLDHLNGETVGVLADGVVEDDQVVSGGAITLPGGRTASKIVAGLGYKSTLKLLRPALTAQDGSHLGRLKSVQEVIIDVHESLGLKAGRKGAEADVMERTTGDPMDQQVAPQSGAFKLHFPGSWRDSAELSIVSDQPLPGTIRAVTRGLEVEP